MDTMKTWSRTTVRPSCDWLAPTLLVLAMTAAGAAQATGTCTEVVSGLQLPTGSILTPAGALLVAESGSGAAHSGRISIVDPSGQRRTLLDGLPSGPSDVGDPSGPTGLLLQGRTLYVTIGVGDTGVTGTDAAGNPVPGSVLPNPNGPSSPIFSSVLAIRLGALVERQSAGFTLSAADEQALAAGQPVTLSNGGADRITIERVVDLPDYVAVPLPNVPGNIKVTNPFSVAAQGSALYVTDGGRNLVWRIDPADGSAQSLVDFPTVPNPLFGSGPGGPTIEAVPTGISAWGDNLLVTLLRGAPFPTGVSSVEQVYPATGADVTLIPGLTTAIEVLPLTPGPRAGFLLLEFSSVGPFFAGPGELLRFDTPQSAPSVVADCLTEPTSMALDRRGQTVYVTEGGGRVVKVPLAP